jgi:hypothetical protein
VSEMTRKLSTNIAMVSFLIISIEISFLVFIILYDHQFLILRFADKILASIPIIFIGVIQYLFSLLLMKTNIISVSPDAFEKFFTSFQGKIVWNEIVEKHLNRKKDI